jgi:hypothetical protein
VEDYKYILQEGKVENILNYLGMTPFVFDMRADLMRLVNAHYKVALTKKDFRQPKDLIKWMNQREQGAPTVIVSAP